MQQRQVIKHAHVEVVLATIHILCSSHSIKPCLDFLQQDIRSFLQISNLFLSSCCLLRVDVLDNLPLPLSFQLLVDVLKLVDTTEELVGILVRHIQLSLHTYQVENLPLVHAFNCTSNLFGNVLLTSILLFGHVQHVSDTRSNIGVLTTVHILSLLISLTRILHTLLVLSQHLCLTLLHFSISHVLARLTILLTEFVRRHLFHDLLSLGNRLLVTSSNNLTCSVREDHL